MRVVEWLVRVVRVAERVVWVVCYLFASAEDRMTNDSLVLLLTYCSLLLTHYSLLLLTTHYSPAPRRNRKRARLLTAPTVAAQRISSIVPTYKGLVGGWVSGRVVSDG